MVKAKSSPKRNHYNPQMLSRRFTDDDEMLFFYDKMLPQKGVQRTQPQNLFVQNHLYAAQNKDGTRNTALESLFSKLEDQTNSIINRIVDSARMGREPGLKCEERALWDLFFYYQCKRVPESVGATWAIADFEATLRREIGRFEKTFRPLTQAEREEFIDPVTIKRLRQNVIVKSLADPGRRVLEVLAQKGLAVLITRKLKKSFVLGSRPVVKLTLPGRTNLLDPSVEMWLPLASDVAVSHMPTPPREKLIECVEDRHIRHLNKSIFKQSRIIAGRSRALIASLAGSD